MWIVDASVAVRWFIAGETHPHAEAVLAAILARPGGFAVPELFAFEVLAVLYRVHPTPADAFERGVLPILQGGLHRHPITQSLSRNARPFIEAGLTGYDATYAALAREVGGEWLTFDRKAHRRIARFGVSVCLAERLPEGIVSSS